MNYEILDGRIAKTQDGSTRIVSASEFWDLSNKSSIMVLDLVLLGFAQPLLKINAVDGSIHVSLELKTEIGVLPSPNKFSEEWDHCVVGNYWIPIRREYFTDIWECFNRLGIDLAKELTKSNLFQLLRECLSRQIEIELPSNFDSSIFSAPQASNLALLKGAPYEYQKIGINWLCDYFDNGIGALLCDEMGLGKTYQLLGLISHVANTNRKPILICCPATLVGNWLSEINIFLSGIEFEAHVGSDRDLNIDSMNSKRFVITTYDLLVRDFVLFQSVDWGLLICDEAQALKNRKSQRRNAVKSLGVDCKFLVTGTPVENSLTDLWSLADIAYEGLLGSAESFESLNEDTPDEARKLGERSSPLILRRMVKDVAKDLPELIEIDEPLFPSSAFSSAYEEVREGLTVTGEKENFLVIHNRLTQLCCYPGLVIDGYLDNEDSKFIRLSEILNELSLANQDKVIIFTTFTESLDKLRAFVQHNYGEIVSYIDGRVPTGDRQQLVENFNNSEGFKVLIANPRAAGTGLNIQGANHVIHFNRQWNPQLESQATRRAYRRKQLKPVFVHKFFYLGTIEEVINERLASKIELADSALENAMSHEEDMFKSKALLITPSNNKRQE